MQERSFLKRGGAARCHTIISKIGRMTYSIQYNLESTANWGCELIVHPSMKKDQARK